MIKPNVLVLTGYGINCDEETAFAFEQAGATSNIVHINDLIDGYDHIDNYQILAFPGGFSYGDDTGSGNALANKIKNNYWEELQQFISEDKLAMGICNGFQVMVNLGILPAFDGKQEPQVALTFNDNARYTARWVDLFFYSRSPWARDISFVSLPIAHGEGKFYVPESFRHRLREEGLVAATYYEGSISKDYNLPFNPNGSVHNIASITNSTGKLIGMMPHPERAITFTQHPDWPLVKERYKRAGHELPEEAGGLQLFKNGVNYFR